MSKAAKNIIAVKEWMIDQGPETDNFGGLRFNAYFAWELRLRGSALNESQWRLLIVDRGSQRHVPVCLSDHHGSSLVR